jgi:tellurite resistance protein TerC
MNNDLVFWLIFSIVFILIFTIDMSVTSHRKGELKVKTAFFWSALWFSVAILFAILIYFYFPQGKEKSFEFFAAYLIEYSLSVDNLFVFIMIFQVMAVESRNRPRILKWGIIGAVILRIIFILAGVELIRHFDFILYVFGVILIFTAYKMSFSEQHNINPKKNFFIKMTKKFFPIDTGTGTDHFFVKHNKKKYATIAFITLILVESTDLIFAIDSIPAVLAITHDSFIAITSNLFAVLGLRSLFFALAGLLKLFRFLKYGISFILFFIGIKMLVASWVHIPVQFSLTIIITTLAVAIISSTLIKENPER